MKNFKLHFATLDLDGCDIPVYEFKKHEQMVDFIDNEYCGKQSKKVLLISKDEFSDVFVSDNYLSIIDFINKKYLYQTVGNYFLQEYSSYEEAYKVALNMAEVSELCYENN
jgi:hypothetical protein